MLKLPIILLIAPSRYWLLAQYSLLIGLAMLGHWAAGGLAVLAVMLLVGGLSWRAYMRQPSGLLCLTSTASVIYAHWQPLGGQSQQVKSMPTLSEQHQVRCDYLGPWLIGLYVGSQRVWLWPDSASPEHLREVRKLFHRAGR